MITLEPWEICDDRSLTYPVITPSGIREMTKQQILLFIIGNPYYFSYNRTHEIRTRI